jgi:hypothetical protein
MIARVWHGYTTFSDADVYENLLTTEIFYSIEKKNVAGYRSIQLFRRPLENEVEFMTLMLFDNIEAVKAFIGGDDYETAYVPAKAREVLVRFDSRSQHYVVREHLVYT